MEMTEREVTAWWTEVQREYAALARPWEVGMVRLATPTYSFPCLPDGPYYTAECSSAVSDPMVNTVEIVPKELAVSFKWGHHPCPIDTARLLGVALARLLEHGGRLLERHPWQMSFEYDTKRVGWWRWRRTIELATGRVRIRGRYGVYPVGFETVGGDA
jgi:hypothetical protein